MAYIYSSHIYMLFNDIISFISNAHYIYLPLPTFELAQPMFEAPLQIFIRHSQSYILTLQSSNSAKLAEFSRARGQVFHNFTMFFLGNFTMFLGSEMSVLAQGLSEAYMWEHICYLFILQTFALFYTIPE